MEEKLSEIESKRQGESVCVLLLVLLDMTLFEENKLIKTSNMYACSRL